MWMKGALGGVLRCSIASWVTSCTMPGGTRQLMSFFRATTGNPRRLVSFIETREKHLRVRFEGLGVCAEAGLRVGYGSRFVSLGPGSDSGHDRGQSPDPVDASAGAVEGRSFVVEGADERAGTLSEGRAQSGGFLFPHRGSNVEDVKGVRDLEKLLALCKSDEGGSCSERTAQSFHRIRQLPGDRALRADIVEILIRHAKDRMSSFNPRHMVMVMNSLSAIVHKPDADLWRAISNHAILTMSYFDSAALGLFLGAAVKLQAPIDDELFGAMCARTEESLSRFSPRDADTFISACSALGKHPGDFLLGKLIEIAEKDPQAKWRGLRDKDPRVQRVDVGDVLKAMTLSELLQLCKEDEQGTTIERPAQILHRMTYCPQNDEEIDELILLLTRQLIDRAALFEPRHMSMTLNAFAKLRRKPDPELLQCIQAQALERMSDFNAQGMITFVWAQAKIGVELPDAVMESARKQCCCIARHLRPQDIANLMHAFSLMRQQPGDALFAELCQLTETRIYMWSSKDVTYFLAAVATLGLRPGDKLLEKIYRRGRTLLADFMPQTVGFFLWSCATLKYQIDSTFFLRLCKHTEIMLEEFGPKELSQFVWACGSLGLELDLGLFDKICGRAEATLQHFNQQDLSNFMWACGTLGMQPRDILFSRMCDRATKLMPDFSTQGLTSFMVGCARCGMQPPEDVYELLCKQMQKEIQSQTAQGVANFMWSCAKLRTWPGDELFSALCEQSLATMHAWIPETIAIFLTACAKLSLDPGDQLFTRIFEHSEELISSWGTQSVSNFLWACGSLRHEPPKELMQKLCDQVARGAWDMTPQIIANIFSGCAKLQMKPSDALIEALADRVGQSAIEFNDRDATVLMEACQALGLKPSENFFEVLENRLNSIKGQMEAESWKKRMEPSSMQ